MVTALTHALVCRPCFLPAVTQEEFYDFFGQFGEVSDSIVMFDRDTHRSRGFGFVTYEDQVCPWFCTE